MPIMRILYPTGHSSGVLLLTILGGASFFVCLSSITTAVLQASQRELYPVFSMLAGGTIKIAVNWVLVGDPRIGIYGAPIGTLVCYIAMCFMNRHFIRRRLQHGHILAPIFFLRIRSQVHKVRYLHTYEGTWYL